ncbi:ABC transporter, partial [Methanosalsum natronophilum]
ENDIEAGKDSDVSPEDVSEKDEHFVHPSERFEMDQQATITLFQTQTISTPSHFSPPIPFMAILYSFLFIFPIYIIAQLYSSSMMEERTNRKCQLLLAAPLRSIDIVLGKTAPYIITLMLLVIIISTFIQQPSTIREVTTVFSMALIMLPVILLFMALSFIAAIFSRSFKELTFSMVFLSVIVSGYLFFPAMFANIHAVSAISPMTLIVNLVEGNQIDVNTYLFSTVPFYLVSLSLYGLGTSIFNEENLFSQKNLISKSLDSIEKFLEFPGGSVFTLSLVSIPFIYMLQLMFIIILFNLPLPYSILIMIFLSAFVEELAKSIGILTIIKKKLEHINLKKATLLSILAGTGFFVGEKLISV